MKRNDYRVTLPAPLGSSPTQAAVILVLTIITSIGITLTAAARDFHDDRTMLNEKSLSFVVAEMSGLFGAREQPVALQRILGIDQSLALTRVPYNNRLVLVNPHRRLFDQLGFVDTGEFLATTLTIHENPENQAVVSANTIHVSEQGYIALTTPGVTSEAVVIAAVKTSPSDAERKIVFDFMSDGLVQYAIGESELDQLTGVDGKALGKASSAEHRPEAVRGHMLVNARSAVDIQRSVMNTENVPRARQLVVENGLIRLKGESPLEAMTRTPSRKPMSLEHPASEDTHQVPQKELSGSKIITAMVNPISAQPVQESGSVSNGTIDRGDGASSPPNHVESRKAAPAKKPIPADSRIQKARGADRKSGTKHDTKARKTLPLSQSHQAQSTPWSSSMKGGLPEWMKYLPKTESTAENLPTP